MQSNRKDSSFSVAMVWAIVSCFLWVGFASAQTTQQKAFPSAEGFGRYSEGGRGGEVHHVTNLNDSGSGSLRACMLASGRRTCVFDVGGTIRLQSAIKIEDPYLTVAGQTAPGDGIAIRDGTVSVRTHDVILRHLRLRPGLNTENPTASASLSVVRPASNVIADHISATWHPDESAEIWGNVENVTYQWSIIAEGLHCTGLSPSEPCHGKGLLTGGGTNRYSIIKSLLANNPDRNGLIKDGDVQFINNVIYNYGSSKATQFVPETRLMRIDLVGNYYLPGPGTSNGAPVRPPVEFAYSNNSLIYPRGNYHPTSRPDNSFAETAIFSTSAGGTLSADKRQFPAIAGEVNADTAYTQVLNGAGATMPRRDSVDSRIVNNVKQRSGSFIDSESEVGGYPTFSSASRPAGFDTDRDGMADEWERTYGLDPSNREDGGQRHGNGYTNLENYLNVMAGDSVPGLSPGTGEKTPKPPEDLTIESQ